MGHGAVTRTIMTWMGVPVGVRHAGPAWQWHWQAQSPAHVTVVAEEGYQFILGFRGKSGSDVSLPYSDRLSLAVLCSAVLLRRGRNWPHGDGLSSV